MALSAPGGLSPHLEITTLSTRNARVVCRVLYGTYMPTLWMDEQSAPYADLEAGAVKGFPSLRRSRARG